jgi:thiol-disulfide isomerase/thioredoxin
MSILSGFATIKLTEPVDPHQTVRILRCRFGGCVRTWSRGRPVFARKFEPAGRLFCAALILLISGAARAQITEKELAGKLVEVNGKFTQPLRAPATVVPKYIALYYGAGWCGPCHKFTPDLVAFYNDLRPKYSDFQVIFMSRDTSAAEMTNYMVEMKMPWPALRYDAVKWSPLNKYCGPGIPCLGGDQR